MRILITGAAGLLGGKLIEVLADKHDVTGADIVGENVEKIDITDFGATRAFVADHKPEVVLHLAAWTDVDGCTREPEKAVAVNGLGAQNVALAAAAVGAAVLYVSSNEVFVALVGGDRLGNTHGVPADLRRVLDSSGARLVQQTDTRPPLRVWRIEVGHYDPAD